MRLELSTDLTPLRVAATARVDLSAGEVRKLFITDVPGQDMVYQQKLTEAEMVTADPAVPPAQVPHIASEAQLNGISLLDQAAIIVTMSHQWRQVSSVIEATRLAAKQAILDARSPAEIEAAANVDWSQITG